MRFLTAILLVFASTAQAESILTSHFGNPKLPSRGCYLRNYSAAHLAKHPAQTVTSISLMPSALQVSGVETLLDLFVTLRDNPYHYHGLASCEPDGDALACYLDRGLGAFKISAENPGALRLKIGALGIAFQGDKLITLSGTTGDDRVFVIPNVSGENCG